MDAWSRLIPVARTLPACAALALSGCVVGDVPRLDSLPPGGTLLPDADPAVPVSFSAEIEVPDGGSGTVVLELTPAWDGGLPRRFEVEPGVVSLTGLLPGDYGLRAWLDRDGDGAWDGIWEDGGEPTAVMGLHLPRTGLRLTLRTGVPEPILDGDPAWVDLYHAAWEMAGDHVAAGTPDNGFADHYLDEAFSEQIFQWDTCFMTLFGRYGVDAFPVMPSLDNFYATQRDDGYICRVVDEGDGQPGGDPSDPAEPMINPPLFAWVELEYVRQTGDLSRLPRVLPVLDAYADWMDANVRTGPGLYYTSPLGSGMDNAPRYEAYDAWVDVTAQQALARASMAELAAGIGDGVLEAEALAEADRICADIRDWTWDPNLAFFVDLGQDATPLPEKTLAGVWPLLAGCATADQAAEVVDHLQDPAEFWRVHVFPSLSADSPSYEGDGHYWLGGVWAPTNYATGAALDAVGRGDLARDATANHLDALARVYEDYVPDEALLSPEAIGDGQATLWELYAPDAFTPGTRWDDTYLGRQDFVGWTGVGPIASLLEHAVGLRADARADTLTWRLGRTDRHGVLGYRFGDQLVDLVASEREAPGDPVTLDIETSDPFTLILEWGDGQQETIQVPGGSSSGVHEPAGGGLTFDPVPAGPFPGYAVAGNGRVSAVISDDDGTDDPPGITHLYRGHFGLDLLDGGRTRIVHEGDRIRTTRVGLDPFFAAYAETPLPDGGHVARRAFVGGADAVVVQGALVGGDAGTAARIVPHLQLRETPHIDGGMTLANVAWRGDAEALVAEYSDGTALALRASPVPSAWQAGEVTEGDAVLGLSSQVSFGHHLALQLDLVAAAGEELPFVWTVAVGDGADDALAAAAAVVLASDPLEDAEAHWADWAPEALCDATVDGSCRVAAANLYAARSSSLGGRVPADLTGQFVTDGFPQLYPRDALMVARAFELGGHDDEAWEIVLDWLDGGRDGPSAGAWYARYDALGRAVDGGSGAAYDVPEWDSNGYLAVLVERLGPDELTVGEQDVVLDGLDFLVANQDADGLFSEGGIVEWEGRLPATAMTSWAGLDAGARLADRWGEPEKATDYRAAAGRIRGGLLRLLDFDRVILGDERDGSLAYDTSMLFGPAWGYPPGPVLDASYGWFIDHATAHGGGVRYFEGMGYGQDLFFFTTSATAQYAASAGDGAEAADLIDWMLAFTNRYGLAPERVHADGSGAAEASPLSWCAAELAVAVLEIRRIEALGPVPVVDGLLEPAEYRESGACAVDADGDPDQPASPVTLCAARDGDELQVALRVAAPLADLAQDTRYAVYLAGEDGQGSAMATEGGLPLSFRAPPEGLPGAAARILLDPISGGCVAGPSTVDGYADSACADSARGDLAMEARVDLGVLGLSPGPLQAIVAAEIAGEEELLPHHGALLTEGVETGVLVTFEVDAAGVTLGPGESITLSGDRPELGDWAGHAIPLSDDGSGGDRVAGDDLWTVVVETDRAGALAYKYLTGVPGDPGWDGVEFEGDDRSLYVVDVDASGRVLIRDVFAVPGGELGDP